MSTTFYEILVDEEEYSGSESGESEEFGEEDVLAEYEVVNDAHGLQLEVEVEIEEDTEWNTNIVNVRTMPILTTNDDGSMHPMNASLSSPLRSPPQQPGTSAFDSDRERSPLLHSPTPPPYSPIGSPRLVALPLESDEEVEQKPTVAWVHPGVASTSRGHYRSPRSRPRGSIRGRARRTATRAVFDESVWRRGDQVTEVCLNDEDVPQRLREMVHELEATRNGRIRQHRRRNVRANDDSDSENEFHDAESLIAKDLFDGDQSALHFEWSPMATFKGVKEEFRPQHTPGPRRKTTSSYAAFRQYWDDAIMEHIVTETNRHALTLNLCSENFKKEWYETNVHEIMILFAFWIMLGILRMPSIKSCFSNNILLETRIFRILMTDRRYWLLSRALNFVDDSTRTPGSCKSFSLGPIVDHLNKKFKEAYTLDQNISIDESLTLSKGQLSFRQNIRTKAARFGIKTFALCESATGYMWSFLIYMDKDRNNVTPKLPKSTEIVLQLVKPLLNQGYTLFLDNWFNSPILARFLKRNRTDCVGTLRNNRKNVPALLKLANIPEGKCIARHSGDVVVMAYQNKKTVYTISTCHGSESVFIEGKGKRPPQYRPAVINDYNFGMGGVDRKDHLLEPYLIERKRCNNWYKKMFKRLLNVSILNSRILVDKSTDNEIKQIAFRLNLVEEILKRHLAHVPKQRQKNVTNRNAVLHPGRLIGRHYIVRSEVSEQRTSGSSRTSRNRRYCVWCTHHENRHSKTVWICEQCLVPLCVEGCFKKYHETP